MAHHGASLLRFIGNVLHIPPNSYILPDKLNGACNQDSPVKVFEESLATRLNSLIPPEDSQTLSLEWLEKAMQVSTATNLDAQTFIPEVQLPLTDRDEKWITNYLDCSLNILSMCNKMREAIAGIGKILMLVKLTLHLLNLQAYSNQSQLGRVKDAVCECFTALESWSETTHAAGVKGNHKNGYSLIEDMPKMLFSAKSEHAMRKQGFLTVLYAAKLTTILICSIVVTAFTRQKGFLVELPVPESSAWSLPILSLQRTVRAATIKRTAKGLKFFIPELSNLEFCLSKLNALLDGYENDVATFEEELKEKATNFMSDLKHQSEALEKSLKLLEGEIDGLFHLTIANRKLLLDKLKG